MSFPVREPAPDMVWAHRPPSVPSCGRCRMHDPFVLAQILTLAGPLTSPRPSEPVVEVIEGEDEDGAQ